MNKSRASTLLTIFGAIGVVATAVTAVKNAPKAEQLVNKAELDKGESLTFFEKTRAATPAYIPTALIGASTIACIIGSNVLNKQSQAALASAYALLRNSYDTYRRKVNDIYGEDADDDVIAQMAADEYNETVVDYSSEQGALFLDYNTMQFFRAHIEDVIQKVQKDDGTEYYIICTPLDMSIFS